MSIPLFALISSFLGQIDEPMLANMCVITYVCSIPQIDMVGPREVLTEVGACYDDPGAKACAEVFGDLSDEVLVSGGVDSEKTGTYCVTYTVIDPCGNAADCTRVVHVVGPGARLPVLDRTGFCLLAALLLATAIRACGQRGERKRAWCVQRGARFTAGTGH